MHLSALQYDIEGETPIFLKFQRVSGGGLRGTFDALSTIQIVLDVSVRLLAQAGLTFVLASNLAKTVPTHLQWIVQLVAIALFPSIEERYFRCLWKISGFSIKNRPY